MKHFYKGAIGFFVLALLLAMPVCPAALAQQQGGWLTVDYAILLGFHPGMYAYDFAMQRFYKSDVPLGKPKALKAYQKKALELEKKYFSKIQELERKKAKLLKSMGEAENAHIQEVNRLLKDNKSVSAVKKAYKHRLADRNKSLEKINKDYEAIQDKIFGVYYLSKEESEKHLLSIMGEIDMIIRQIAHEYDNAAVIDRSYLAPASLPFTPPTPISGFDELGASVYAQLLKTDLSIPQMPFNPQAPPEHYKNLMGGIENRFQENLQKVLTQAPSLRPVIANVRPNFFLSGGQDITVEALQEILKRQNVSEAIILRIMQTLPFLQ